MNKKLRQIGQRLDITERDIKDIGKAGIASKILYWIITAIIAIITFIIGFFIGQGNCSTSDNGGYPFAIGSMIPGVLAGKRRSSKIAILLFSMVAFLVAIKAYPAFGQAIKYNVYRR